MGSVREVLADSLTFSLGEWFSPDFQHPFFQISFTVVPDSVKPIPANWVNDIELDEFGAEMGDVMGEGPVLSWSPEELNKRLVLALKRLDLSEDGLNTKKVNTMSRQELSHEKKRVKQELKRYDTEWRKQFKSLPNHSQKEVMRPLYIYYRKLKQQLVQVEQSRAGGLPGPDDSDDDAEDRQSMVADAVPTPESLVNASKPKGKKPGPYIEVQITQLEARANTLQQEKSTVRSKLREFQEGFVIQHHRKIRFHKDILPIEREYRMYKNIKEEIAKVESQLRTLRGSQ
eukprot:CAMPEP_0197656634 /NCGR_PEP_ID=MMETSP1338-20131121/42661_1 /TAXON_ID=43686 ORGANISM="Pelagodinium beii, Strain RCC1491" /NCGR_SAMPLE_ID=MMETSP1338 /ASSEMBLY_ACC=CAM_ASM_000754 /LENGTH=286 /DNA_ID=CAMNT_0043232721 /DNA_START=40 /DNA_END=900 /DNA_ORIENTATION=+